MSSLLGSLKLPKPSVPQFPRLQNEHVRDGLFPELSTTGSQQQAGTGTAWKPFLALAGGGKHAPPLSEGLEGWLSEEAICRGHFIDGALGGDGRLPCQSLT